MDFEPSRDKRSLRKKIIRKKAISWIRLILRASSLAWAIVVVWNLTRTAIFLEQTLVMMILGGGLLFFMGKCLHRWERAARRECRRIAKDMMIACQAQDVCFNARSVVSCLVEQDLKHLKNSRFRKRLEDFLERFVIILAQRGKDRTTWLKATSASLWSLELAKGHWGPKQFQEEGLEEKSKGLFFGFRDEEILELLLASILAVSALFRLHLLIWGMPAGGLHRQNISRLRTSWLPFCAMEPTEVMFPPSLPQQLEKDLLTNPSLWEGKEISALWLTWLGHGSGLDKLLCKISSR